MTVADTGLGKIFVQHVESLPTWQTKTPKRLPWPWVVLFIVVPLAGTVGLQHGAGAHGTTPSHPPVSSDALLAGIGVLGGLLFQVLAWVSGRIGTIADGMGERPATDHELSLIRRLDIARANIAYASLVSIVFVAELGVVSMMNRPPGWVAWVSSFLLLHLSLTLVLVLVRINNIGQADRVAALTAHARKPKSEV